MIKNEREFRISMAQAKKFERALALLEKSPEDTSVPELIRRAERDALASQLADLRAQLRVYEALRSGRRRLLKLDSFDDLPAVLIQARIALNLNQKALAERLGLKEQQIQRYEATGYASANLARILQVIHALGLKVSAAIPLSGRHA
jgi:ribosome-binding protein aMBF1 (putative translation factor)